MSAPKKPILISGAGIASLLLAQCLRRASIPFLIFERDASVSFRAQGYRLRLSAQGLDAIESVLSPAAFQDFWAVCGKTSGGDVRTLSAISGAEMDDAATAQPTQRTPATGPPPPPPPMKETLTSRGGQTVGVARGDMRTHFLRGCEHAVQWSRNVTGYELSGTGVRAVFADGSTSVEGAMLVGGEGIYSKVAKQLSRGKIKTYDTGARGIHGQAPTTAFKGLGEGVWRIVDDTRADGRVFVITNVRGGGDKDANPMLGWTMGAQVGVINVPGDDLSLVGKQAAELAKSLTRHWHPTLKPLFDEMVEAEAAFWKFTCSTPAGVPEWENESRVTVIGDAVHSMTPAGGLGANTAVRDSALLGRLLVEAGGHGEGVTAAYEKEMRIYGSEAVAASYGMASGQFGINIDENSKTV